MKGISNVVQMYLLVGKEQSGKVKVILSKCYLTTHQKIAPPNGNTILHIVGAWIFEAIKLCRLG
jgi:hypothetical protein